MKFQQSHNRTIHYIIHFAFFTFFPHLRCQLLSIIWMTFCKSKYFIAYFISIVNKRQSLKQIKFKIFIRNLIQMKQLSKVEKWRFLLLKYFAHHRLLASQKQIIYILMQLHNRSQQSVKILINICNLLKLIKHHNYPILLRCQCLQKSKDILYQHTIIHHWLNRNIYSIRHWIERESRHNPKILNQIFDFLKLINSENLLQQSTSKILYAHHTLQVKHNMFSFRFMQNFHHQRCLPKTTRANQYQMVLTI